LSGQVSMFRGDRVRGSDRDVVALRCRTGFNVSRRSSSGSDRDVGWGFRGVGWSPRRRPSPKGGAPIALRALSERPLDPGLRRRREKLGGAADAPRRAHGRTSELYQLHTLEDVEQPLRAALPLALTHMSYAPGATLASSSRTRLRARSTSAGTTSRSRRTPASTSASPIA
jgi:hypothetical protein